MMNLSAAKKECLQLLFLGQHRWLPRYYFDTGASDLIIKKKIQLKHGSLTGALAGLVFMEIDLHKDPQNHLLDLSQSISIN